MARLLNLIRCSRCDLNSMVPLMDVSHEVPKGWYIKTRCTSCYTEREYVVSQANAGAYDEALDRERAAMIAIAQQQDRAAFEDFTQRFTAALEADALLPEDFHV